MTSHDIHLTLALKSGVDACGTKAIVDCNPLICDAAFEFKAFVSGRQLSKERFSIKPQFSDILLPD